MAQDTAQNKVAEICKQLTKDTLEPAQEEAKRIIEDAEKEASSMIENAKKEIEELQKAKDEHFKQKTSVYESSIRMALNQALSMLRTQITEQLFAPKLRELLQAGLNETTVIASLIQAIVEDIREKGVNTSLQASIAKGASVEEVNKTLISAVKDQLQEHSVSLGAFNGGVTVKLVEDNISLEITDTALKELVMQYVSEELRNVLFTMKT